MRIQVLAPIVIIFALFTLASQQKSSSENTSRAESTLQHIADSLLLHENIEAISIGVVHGSEAHTLHVGSFSDGSNPSDSSLYEIASLTKTFTGTLLAQGITEGKIQLEDDIRLYLDGDFPNLQYDNQPILVKHLVTHQSGLPHMFPDVPGLFENPDWDKLPFEINKLQNKYSRRSFFEALHNVTLLGPPGGNLQYSNVGANLLGYILEKIYNKPLNDILKENIFKPLQMSRTEIASKDVTSMDVVRGHNANGLEMPGRAVKDMNAEGGIVSTVVDMIKYMQYHLSDNPIIHTSHQHLWDGQFGSFESGLFWQIQLGEEQPEIIFQNGGAFGTSSWLTLVPDQEIGVFMITNASGPDIHQNLQKSVMDIVALISE